MGLYEEAKALQDEMTAIRRQLHEWPELGFELPKTKALVWEKLTEMGYEPQECGRAGITASLGKPGKTILLRADMDALPMKEETGLPFSSKNDWMHSCGHDTHVAMLLGAAKLLKAHESELAGCVKFMFQPAEEILAGSADMLNSGILENPKVDAAFGMHIMSELPCDKIVYADRYVNASADKFIIRIKGRGGHGAMPENAVDPLLCACYINVALQEILGREISGKDLAVITVCHMESGEKENIIPETAFMEGTTRAYSGKVREYMKKRMEEICVGVAAAYRCECTVEWPFGVSPNENDPALQEEIIGGIREFLGEEKVLQNPASMGSEDFANVSQAVPSVFVSLGARVEDDSKVFGQHSNHVLFDERVFATGAAVYANTAMRWLKKHA